MRLLLLCLIVSIHHSCLAQDYRAEITRAGEAYDAQHFDSCAIYFGRAFLLKDPLGSDLYNAAICNARIGNFGKALALLNDAIGKGINISKLKIDPELDTLHDQAAWKKLLKRGEGIQQDSFQRCLYPDYAKELAKIWELDQFYRFQLGAAFRSGDTIAINALWQKMRTADSINNNVPKLEAIITRIGWPTISKVGRWGASTAFLVIDHSSRETMEKFLPYLEEAAIKGEATMSNYATMQDRVLVNRGKKQTYGTQSYQDNKGKVVLFPIEDEQNLNCRRKEVGLDPLPAFPGLK